MGLEVNDYTYSKVFLCQEDIKKLNVDVAVNTANKTFGGERFDGAIHKDAGP